MTATGVSRSDLLDKLRHAIQGSIHQFSLWILPLAILLGSIWALLYFRPLYPSTAGTALYFRSLPMELGHNTPQEAFAALQTMPQKRQAEIQRGAWLSFELPERARAQPTAVDFPAPNADAITCWRRDTMQTVGRAHGPSTTEAMRTSRHGYALMLGQNESGAGSSFSDLICQVAYHAPTTFTSELWSIPDLRAASDRFHRAVALFQGGILTLAVFLAFLGLRNREWACLLVAVWVVGNLRLGSYALGWDSQWLGHSIPADWQPLLRQLTLAGYYLLSFSLFTRLFRQRSLKHPRVVSIVQWLGVGQLAAALILPWSTFQVFSASAWALALAAAAYLTLRSAKESRGGVVSWRMLAFGASLPIILWPLAFTLTGDRLQFDIITSVVALLLSNVTAVLAVSGIIRAGKRERHRAQTQLVTSYAVAPLGMFTLDGDGRFVQMNPILRNMLGLRDDAPPTLSWDDFFEPQDWEEVVATTLAGSETDICLIPKGSPDTPPLHFALRAALVSDHVEGSLQDITARTQAMDELRNMIDNDPLTQALNRRGIEKELDQALANLQAHNLPCSIAYMDLDHFKRINGLFGHTSGDEILKQITAMLRSILTAQQTLGRIGSDEFIILFPDVTAPAARVTAERIILDLNSASYQVGHRYFHVRAAIGVVEIHPGMDAAAAISAASRACRDARKQNQDVVVYEQDSSELQAHTEELRLFDQLEGGASPKGLYLEMQPIMALNNPGESLNFEILLRVRDSNGKLVPTGQIVSSAEESGTISIIDKWVFSATLEWLSKHEDRLRKTQLVNVNLSGVSLNNDAFIDNLFQVLGRHSHLARRLCVEITEGVALQNLDRTRRLIARLQSMGVRIALDDFGAGYTSFSYLKQLGADAVKIDGTLVKDMLASGTNIAIVRTIVELAQNLGMVSIAEWVEDVQALEVLREMGVDFVQGYAVSPALTPMEILDAESITDLVSNADTLAYIKRNTPPPSLPAVV